MTTADASTAKIAPRSGTLPPITREPLTPGEVRELWAFVHGDIMVGGIRTILRQSLGLCPRHTWAYAAVEIELWEHGAGARGGHQPFDVTILYRDLAAEVGEKLNAHHAPWHTDLRDVITPTQGCRICADLRGTDQSKPPVGYAGMDIPALTTLANKLHWTTEWLRETATLWDPQVCPRCRKDAPESVGVEHDDVLCRTHLTATPLNHHDAASVGARLGVLANDMASLAQSMTRGGPHATPQQNSSWIAVLGWFAGWQTPLDIAAARP